MSAANMILGLVVVGGIAAGAYYLYTTGFFGEKYDPQKTTLFKGGKEPAELRKGVSDFITDMKSGLAPFIPEAVKVPAGYKGSYGRD